MTRIVGGVRLRTARGAHIDGRLGPQSVIFVVATDDPTRRDGTLARLKTLAAAFRPPLPLVEWTDGSHAVVVRAPRDADATLAAWVATKPVLSVQTLRSIAIQLVDALKPIHAAGLAHGDICPDVFGVRTTPVVNVSLLQAFALVNRSIERATGVIEDEFSLPATSDEENDRPSDDVFAYGRLLEWLARETGTKCPAWLETLIASTTHPDPSKRPASLDAIRTLLTRPAAAGSPPIQGAKPVQPIALSPRGAAQPAARPTVAVPLPKGPPAPPPSPTAPVRTRIPAPPNLASIPREAPPKPAPIPVPERGGGAREAEEPALLDYADDSPTQVAEQPRSLLEPSAPALPELEIDIDTSLSSRPPAPAEPREDRDPTISTDTHSGLWEPQAAAPAEPDQVASVRGRSRAPLGRKLGRLVLPLVAALALAAIVTVVARKRPRRPLPSLESAIGFPLGDDGRSPDWAQMVRYFEMLDRASNAVKVENIGRTAEGRPLLLVLFGKPETLARAADVRERMARLADPRRRGPRTSFECRPLPTGWSSCTERDDESARLAEETPAVVLITAGVHATEIGSTQVALRIADRLVHRDFPGARAVYDNTVVLLVPSMNPDGYDSIVHYLQRARGRPFEVSGPIPVPAGHWVEQDTNRDGAVFALPETRALVAATYAAWHPILVIDLHQYFPNGARAIVPPYRDPVGPNVDGDVLTAEAELGADIVASHVRGGRSGIVSPAIFDGFGPARFFPHYRNAPRILIEVAAARRDQPARLSRETLTGATPSREDTGYDPRAQSTNHTTLWPGGTWRHDDSLEYLWESVRPVLAEVAEHKKSWLERSARIANRAVDHELDRPRAWIIKPGWGGRDAFDWVVRSLIIAGVEVRPLDRGASMFVDGHQPYRGFAATVLSPSAFAPRFQAGGAPIGPYDVSSYNLAAMNGVDVETIPGDAPLPSHVDGAGDPMPQRELFLPARGLSTGLRVGVYRSVLADDAEGWVRYAFDLHRVRFEVLDDRAVRAGGRGLRERVDAIYFPSLRADRLRDGIAAGRSFPEYTGGLGVEGMRALTEYVELGGHLVAEAEATELLIAAFGLPVTAPSLREEPVTFAPNGGLARVDGFACEALPYDRAMPQLAKGATMFAIAGDSPELAVLARYADAPTNDGWIHGYRTIASQPAVVRARRGRGAITLIGFQPFDRAQSIPLIGIGLALLHPTSCRESDPR